MDPIRPYHALFELRHMYFSDCVNMANAAQASFPRCPELIPGTPDQRWRETSTDLLDRQVANKRHNDDKIEQLKQAIHDEIAGSHWIGENASLAWHFTEYRAVAGQCSGALDDAFRAAVRDAMLLDVFALTVLGRQLAARIAEQK